MPLLGIDFGTKTIGLAAEVAGIAMPVGSLSKKDAIEALKPIVAERKITGFVIGRPNHADNSVSKETLQMRSFKGELKKAFPDIPVSEEDERFSSASAYFSLEEAGISRKEAGRIDEMAATIILQNYLDRSR
jgi:putative Holliday junction resolvase